MRFLITFIWLVFISVPGVSQPIEDGWKGLLPIQSTKTDAEKVFGKGVQTKKLRWYQYRYDTEDAVVMVDYAAKPCDENSDSLDRYDIPENTILRYEVRLKGLMPITEFTFDINRFERNISQSQNNKSLPHFSYKQWKEKLSKVPNEWNSGIGIEFWGNIVRDIDYVRGFYFGPSHTDVEKRRCEKTYSQ